MNNCKKTIKLSDITTTPIKLKYSSSYQYADFEDYGIAAKKGLNASVQISGSVRQNALNYKLVQNLYYQNYLTGSTLNSTSSWDWNTQSTACSGSSEYEDRYFPTASDSIVGIISSPSIVFGENISRGTFQIIPEFSTSYRIIDDGNGNLIDTANSNTHVGNLIYSQGVAVITNQDYSDAFSESNAFSNRITSAFVIPIINTASGLSMSSFGIEIDGVGIYYPPGDFPITQGERVLLRPDTDTYSDFSKYSNIVVQFTTALASSKCIRRKKIKRDEIGTIISNSTVESTLSAGLSGLELGDDLVDLNIYSYYEISFSNTCR